MIKTGSQPTLSELMATRRWCYTVPEAQDPALHGGFVPSLVFENEPGHFPMKGKGDGSAPWVWGKTYAEAQATCDAYNAARLGINKATADKIVASTFRRPLTTDH